MRILLLSDWFKPNVIGGAEISVENLARGLSQGGHQVAVGSLRHARRLTREHVDGIDHFGLPIGGMGRSPLEPGRNSLDSMLWQLSSEYVGGVARQLDRLFAEFRPDAVISNNLAGLSTRIWQLAAKRRIPLIHTIRDYYLLCPFGTMYRQGQNCTGQCKKCTLVTLRRRSHSATVPGVVGVSNFVLDAHLASGYFARAKTTAVIRVPYEAPLRSANECTDTAAAGGKTVIGFIGRLHPSKGIEALIAAFSMLRSDNLALCIAGSPFRSEYGQTLRALAAADPRITFTGFMKPAEFYARVDVVAVPSLWNEPLSRVPIEAMAHGKGLVTSDRGGIAELPRESGFGACADPSSSAAFAQALQSACEQHLRGSATIDGASVARRLYSPTAIADQYVDVIDRVRGSAA